MKCVEGRDIKKTFYNLRIFILVIFVIELLKTFDKIIVIDN